MKQIWRPIAEKIIFYLTLIEVCRMAPCTAIVQAGDNTELIAFCWKQSDLPSWNFGTGLGAISVLFDHDVNRQNRCKYDLCLQNTRRGAETVAQNIWVGITPAVLFLDTKEGIPKWR